MWLRWFPKGKHRKADVLLAGHTSTLRRTLSQSLWSPIAAVFLMIHPLLFTRLKHRRETHTFRGWLELPLAYGMTGNATGFVGAHVFQGIEGLS
jgi:hypothetical protein